MMQNKHSGFTLIELMLVVAIIASISVIGVFAYKQQLVNFQVDKTALQMQQWMEAAVAYNVNNNGSWPAIPSPAPAGCTSINQILEATPTSNPCNAPIPVITYIAVGSIDNDSWGKNSFSLSKISDALFQVSISNVPDQNIANRIAARLPSALVSGTSAPYTVSAQVTASNLASSTGGMSIVHMATDVPSNTVITPGPITPQNPWPSCPAGTSVHLYVAPSYFQPPWIGGDPENPGQLSSVTASIGHQTDGSFKPALAVASPSGDPMIASNKMLVIETCESNSSTLSKNTSNNNTKMPFTF